MATNMEIAQVILQQLGGAGRLKMMTGAKDFIAIEKGVQFAIGRNAAGINKVIVKLTEQDLYDVEFGTVRKVKAADGFGHDYKWTVKDSTEGAYAEMLKPLFERATGMYLTF